MRKKKNKFQKMLKVCLKKERKFKKILFRYAKNRLNVISKQARILSKKIKQTATKEVFSPYLKQMTLKTTIIIMIVMLNWLGIAAVGNTLAMFSDGFNKVANGASAGMLNFSLSASDWTPAEKVYTMQPGDTLSKDIAISSEGTLDFQYRINYEKTEGDDEFCSYLDLQALLNGTPQYSGDLNKFTNFNAGVYHDLDVWTFNVSLPAGSPNFAELGCGFKFSFSAWQDSLTFGQGFSDAEVDDYNYLGVPTMLASVGDAYVAQAANTSNYGDLPQMGVRSISTSGDRRSYVKFKFNLPVGSEILEAKLKLFMNSAPMVDRTYGVKRVTGPWQEKGATGITWANQPGRASSNTDTAQTGTLSDTWLSWDVTSDVNRFVSGTSANYGWAIQDVDENSSVDNQAAFNTRESTYAEMRPVLEISFKAPAAATSHLVINEVYYRASASAGQDDDPQNEWVELYNPTAGDLDISGWKICDSLSIVTPANCDVMPASTVIPAKGFGVISATSSTWALWPQIPDNAVKILVDGGSIGGDGLDNNGDEMVIRMADNTLIDQIIFDYAYLTGNEDQYMNPSGTYKSIARVVKGYDSNTYSDWVINYTPNPGTNPSPDASEDGFETIRFADSGIQIAVTAEKLPPLTDEVIWDNEGGFIAEEEAVQREETRKLLIIEAQDRLQDQIEQAESVAAENTENTNEADNSNTETNIDTTGDTNAGETTVTETANVEIVEVEVTESVETTTVVPIVEAPTVEAVAESSPAVEPAIEPGPTPTE